jgi:CRP-like cAMP-binding protein
MGNRNLTWVVAAFACVTIAEWGFVTSLSVDAFRRDGSIAVGYVGLRLFLAAASSFISPVIMHRRPPGQALPEIATIRAVIVAACAGLAASGASLTPLLILLGVDALVSAQYRPAQSALIASLARSPKELVASATGLSTVKTLSQALGAVIGATLLAVTTPAVVFTGVAVIFAVAAIMTLRFGRGRLVASDQRPMRVRDVLRSTAIVVRSPNVTGIFVVIGLRTFVRGMWFAIAVIASLKLLHAGSTGVGLLMLAAGIGSIVAAPLSSMLVTRPRLGTPAALALAGCGVPLAVIAGVPVFDLALALVAAWGIGMAVSDVATSSLLQRLLATPTIPRVTGAIESTKLALEGLGGFLAPVLVSTIGVRGALLVAAFPLPLVVVSGWKTLHRVDASAGERAALLEMLHDVPCLKPLDMATLDSLIGRLSPLFVPDAGTDVFRQHDRGDRFYIIEEGAAEILVDGFAVGRLGPRDSFGERALLRDGPRTATVRALSPLHLYVLPRHDFLAALTGAENESKWTQNVELVEPGELPGFFMGSHEWTRSQQMELLSHLNLFSHLDTRAIGELVDRCSIDRWDQGQMIVHQGDEGDRYYVMLEGRANVFIDNADVNEVRPGDQFGEIALLHGVPRSADVVTTTPAMTLSLGRDDFLPALRTRVLTG